MFARRGFLVGRAVAQRRACFHCSPSVWGKVVHTFRLADIGEGITECEVVKWAVAPKSAIQMFDPLCEVQSDKASVEITSPFEGVVKQLLVNEGQVAKVGEGLCLIEVEEEDTPSTELPTQPTVTSVQKQEQEPPSSSVASTLRLHPLDPNYVPPSQAEAKPPLSPSSIIPEDILAAPSVRHFARKMGIDLAHVAPGRGKDGRVEKKDVEAQLARFSAHETQPPSIPTTREEALTGDVVVELGRTRYGMWKAMTKSLEIPTFGYTTTLDLTHLHNLLPILNAAIPPHYLPSSTSNSNPKQVPIVDPSTFYPTPVAPPVTESGRYTKLTYLPILLKTLSKAMMEWPIFRSSITQTPAGSTASTGGGTKPTLTLRPHTDISLALSTPTGLYTPTMTSVDLVPIYALASRIAHIAYLGRQVPCGLTPAEMPKRGGTISVSNVGAVGRGEGAVPVLVKGGGVAIVALGRAKWVWDVEAGGEGDVRYYFAGGGGGGNGGNGGGRKGRGEERLKISVSWSADHRVVEGAELAAFVESWRRWVEVPERLIAEGT
ncbi:hypothetical protein APHAL10511_002958 [Amanita phalloides]|nr:hypothetical protein APHAL10511_002958 [Amanita phalloides]